MITAADVAAVRSVASIAELFAKLGYEPKVEPIDFGEWQKAGVGVSLSNRSRLSTFFRTARVNALLLESEVRNEASDLCASLSHRNKATNSIIIYRNKNERQFSLVGQDGSRIRRLDVDTDSPRADIVDRLNMLALDGERSCDLRPAFAAALSREATGKKFFRLFRSAVELFGRELQTDCQAPAEEVAREALLLMSRLLFLCFIQQKGWLDGRRRFLLERLEGLRSGESFFDCVLRPLFFDCLNTPAKKRPRDARNLGRIPYLNGGLFEPSSFEQQFPSMSLPTGLLRHVLDDVFERFTISIDETDSGGVHVDPEMLGHVFESLMHEDERAESGTFYTPKAIVDVLTRRAIAARLARGDREKSKAILDAIGGGGIASTLARRILQEIDSLRVLDPACGSGAFLLSSLYALERLTIACHAALRSSTPAHTRKSIVERNLYGVDLKPEAVRLCELRLWLAIVANDTSDVDAVPPLPNLDRNILQGDSLLAPIDFLGDGRADVYREWSFGIRARRELANRYRTAAPAEKPVITRALRTADLELAKAMLQKSVEADRAAIAEIESAGTLFEIERRRPATIDELESRISSCESLLGELRDGKLRFFSYDIHFSEVMSDGGFDVVVGNPPWVRASRVPAAQRRQYAQRYDSLRKGRSAFDQPDLSVAFAEKSLALLNESGVAALLVPGKLANAGYAERLRASLSPRVLEFHDWSREGSEFFDADVFPLGVIFGAARSNDAPLLVDRTVGAEGPVPRSSGSAPWVLVSGGISKVLDSIASRFSTFEEVLGRRPVMGVKTGANGRFFLPDVELRSSSARIPDLGIDIPLDALSRCVRGRDIRRWRSEASTWMLWPPGGRNGGAPAWLRELANARGETTDEYRLAYIRPEHLGIKVVWKDVSRGLQAVAMPASVEIRGCEFRLVPNQTAYCLDASSLDEAYFLSAVLNSTVFGALAVSRAERAKDDHFRYFAALVADLPLPCFSPKERDVLTRLGRRGHLRQNVDGDVDAIVASAYGLKERDVRVITAYLNRSLGR